MAVVDLRTATHKAADDAIAASEAGEGTEQSEATAAATATSDTSTEGGTEVATKATIAGTTEAAASGTEAPEEYFGLDLSDLEPEKRLEVIEALQKRDDHIGKLLRGKDPAAAPVVAEAPVAPEAVTDEAILQALGLDPENNPFDENTAKLAVPMVRKQLEQDQTIARLIEMQELQDIDRTWKSTLTSLEKEFGALPSVLDHEAVMEYAAENGISSPMDAYWRIVGPGRAATNEAMKGVKSAKLAASKAAASGTRPVSTAGDADAPLESKTTKGATREVAAKILRDLGL